MVLKLQGAGSYYIQNKKKTKSQKLTYVPKSDCLEVLGSFVVVSLFTPFSL